MVIISSKNKGGKNTMEQEFLDKLYHEFPKFRERKKYIGACIFVMFCVVIMSLVFVGDAGTLNQGLSINNFHIVSPALEVGGVCMVMIILYALFSMNRTKARLQKRNGVDMHKVEKELSYGQMNWNNQIILTPNYLITFRMGIHIIQYRDIIRLYHSTTRRWFFPLAYDLFVTTAESGDEDILLIVAFGGGKKRMEDIKMHICSHNLKLD